MEGEGGVVEKRDEGKRGNVYCPVPTARDFQNLLLL